VPETFEALADAAQEVVDAATLILGGTAPARSFVSNGEPAYDCCPQLTVHLMSFGVMPTTGTSGSGQTGHPHAVIYQATYRLTIIRCTPQPQDDGTIAAGLLSAHARETYIDLYALFPQLRRMIQRKQLLDADWCRGVSMNAATPVDDQGGCSGWRVDLIVEMGGPSAE
jgi:hypothetical protein